MGRKFFGTINQDKKCPACKGPRINKEHPNSYLCETCEAKACAVCAKINVYGVRVSEDGFAFCRRHWPAYGRYQINRMNMDWASDREFKQWIANRAANLEAKFNQNNTKPIPSNNTETAIDRMMEAIERGITLDKISAEDNDSED